ncbi:DUF2786 domain-containing protein [Vibrio parahaemolyticus]|uniref:DUF2786 domain-containing protein n=1 Tax=Vibrio parahaemolyticus TaxID=670 RepID=UPI0038924F6B
MKDKVLNKIKKLLRLATSSNPNEAALALSRAQKLMQEHGISSNAPELAGVQDSMIDALSTAQKPTKYFGVLAYTVATAFGCEFYFQPTLKNMQIVFIGHNERPEIAGYVFTVLERQLVKARKEFISGLSKRMKRSTKTKRADQFCDGWCTGVHRKVTAFALSETEQEQVKAFKEQQSDLEDVDLRSRKARSNADIQARSDGYVAAQDVVLSHGVNGTETVKLN